VTPPKTLNPKTAAKTIPAKILSRKDEITADFITHAERHITELMTGVAKKRYAAKDFGNLLFIHPRHLTNTLRVTINTSVCDYMEGRILAEAQKLLQTTALSIADIAQHFAYDEPTNFIKFFKSMTGVTPLQYRKSIQ
jgi:AraC-like DNA-binding protein